MATKRYFSDANVLIDYVLQRQPFFDQANEIFELSEKGRITSVVSLITIATTAFYAQKAYTPTETKQLFYHLTSFCDVLPSTSRNLEEALESPFDDLEDAIQNSIAQSAGCTAIITRNRKDFQHSTLAVLTPEELLATL